MASQSSLSGLSLLENNFDGIYVDLVLQLDGVAPQEVSIRCIHRTCSRVDLAIEPARTCVVTWETTNGAGHCLHGVEDVPDGSDNPVSFRVIFGGNVGSNLGVVRCFLLEKELGGKQNTIGVTTKDTDVVKLFTGKAVVEQSVHDILDGGYLLE